GAAFALGVAGGAAAQVQPALRAEPAVERHDHRMVMIDRQGPRRDPAEHLRALLQLRSNQEPALQAFLAAGKPDHDHMMKMDGVAEPRTTPERLAHMEQHMSEMQARMRTQIDATRRFYDQLDPAQKRAFDEMPMLMGGGHMGMGPMQIMMHRMPRPPMPPAPPAPGV
ncbi:MAG: Spy/CpxP family protein refolding chaperone, partial [Phenylobacterium sp.]